MDGAILTRERSITLVQINPNMKDNNCKKCGKPRAKRYTNPLCGYCKQKEVYKSPFASRSRIYVTTEGNYRD